MLAINSLKFGYESTEAETESRFCQTLHALAQTGCAIYKGFSCENLQPYILCEKKTTCTKL